MRSIKSVVAVLLAGGLMVGAAQAQTRAGTEVTSFQVQITVVGSCTAITATAIDFAPIILGSGGSVEQTGSIVVTCANGQAYTLGLNRGSNADANQRRMVHSSVGGAYIPYTLSHTGAGGVVWGEGSSFGELVSGQGTGNPIAHTVYAQATLLGTEPAGQYTDTVTATLTF